MNNPQAYCDFQLCTHPKCWQSFRTAEINFNKLSYLAKNEGLKSLPNERKQLTNSIVEHVNKPVLDLLPSYNIQNIEVPANLTPNCIKYEKFKDEAIINFTRLVNSPVSCVKGHVVKFNLPNIIDINLPLKTNNQDTKKMVWKPSKCTKIKVEETLEKKPRLYSQTLSIEKFATKSFNLRGSMLVQESIKGVNTAFTKNSLPSLTNEESSETFESSDVEQVMRDLFNMSKSERIKFLKETVNEEIISLEDAIFFLNALRNKEVSMTKVTESKGVTVGTSLKSKSSVKSSIKSFINSIKSLNSFRKHSNKSFLSNSTLLSDVTKKAPRTKISQKNIQYVGSSELMISGENGDLQQSDFSNTTCCQLESDSVALQSERDKNVEGKDKVVAEENKSLSRKRQLAIKKGKTFSSSYELKNTTRSFERLSVTSLQIDEKFSKKLKTRNVPLLSKSKRDEKKIPNTSKISYRPTREPKRRNTDSFLITSSSLDLKERKIENISKKTMLKK